MISFNNKLTEHANNTKSLLCIGLDINPDNPDQDRDGNERYWIETIGDEIIAVQVPGQMRGRNIS